MQIGGAAALLTLLALEQEAAALFAQVHQRQQDRARYRHAVGVFEVITAVARQVAGLFTQRPQQFGQRVVLAHCGVGGTAGTDQAGELLRRQTQLVILDTKEIADALEVVCRRLALPAQVLVELRAVDRQLPANFRDRAVVAAGQFEVGSEMIAHAGLPGDANDASLASSRINSEQNAKL
ncbi:hypothetical protein D3C81_594380 [compost metagenome]